MTRVSKKCELTAQIQSVLSQASKKNIVTLMLIYQGLEGLVIKDALSTYEPGKRHWLKVKKDYFFSFSFIR